MACKIGQVSKRSLQAQGYLGVSSSLNPEISPIHFDYIESDGSFTAKIINKFFRTNQSYTKNLVRNNKLYSYQYYAYGQYNIYEIDLSNLKEFRINSRHKLYLEDYDGACIDLETVEPSKVVFEQITKIMNAHQTVPANVNRATFNS